MPTLRRRVPRAAAAHRITAEAIAAWRDGDYHRLHAALGLKPWQPSPLPVTVEPLGCDPDQPPPPPSAPGSALRLWDESWLQAVELQHELYHLAGPPGRGN